MKSFRTNPYPSKEEQHQLAMALKTSQEVINRWFSNRRQKQENKSVLKGKAQYCAISLQYM